MQYNIQSLLYRNDELNAHSLFKEVKYLIHVMPTWPEKKECWVIAHPSKKIIAFNSHGFSDEALTYVQGLIDNNKPIYLVFADESEDDSVITILYKNTPAVSVERYVLSVIIKSLSSNNMCNDFVRIIDSMAKYEGWNFKYIRVETEQYSFNAREVFEDRLPVGWMLYLPVVIMNDSVPSAYCLHTVDNGNGTIIVSKENFNGEELKDVLRANDVEMELASNGLLPLMKEL